MSARNKKKNKASFTYPSSRPQMKYGPAIGNWEDLCNALSGRVCVISSLPARVREQIDTLGDDIVGAGYNVFSSDTNPEIIEQGEFLLWPCGKPLSAKFIRQSKAKESYSLCGRKIIRGNALPPLPFYKQLDVPFPPLKNPALQFIDLFAGVGGFRLAMQTVGGECVFSSEWDKDAQETYCMNFGELPWGDIRAIPADCIPDHDVLCAGFPCQPFSLAGVSARTAINRPNGFQCETQGTLFFDIVRIMRKKKPKVLFLENVKNLVNHDKGRTFKIIREAIEAEGYSFKYKIIDASSRVPQKRMRCYMVCVRNDGRFVFPNISGPEKPLKTVLEKKVPEQYTLSDKMWSGHQNRTKRNLDRGTGFTAFCSDLDKPAHTLVSRYYKDGKECLIPQAGKNPRMLTPRECARLQGFPENFELPCSKTAAYKQMGNSVAVPVITEIALEIAKIIQHLSRKLLIE
ncbi:MAG: DNA (cytosine-5-)-methyltransferase [Kiritimatiellae bacterium]|nr:DNA (cytosine-5-)-methyltransferase [Kiritimatiellia bacterium]